MAKAGVKCVNSTVQQILIPFNPGGGGGGGTLIFSYIQWLGSFFWVQNLEVQYFLGVFRKK